MLQWHIQVGSITTNLKVKIYFTLSGLSAAKIVMWNFHVNEFSKGRYDMILGRYILKDLILNLKSSDHVIEADYEPFKESMATMVDLCMNEFKCLNTGKITTYE